MLIKAICLAATPKIVIETSVEAQPNDLKPRLSTCGIGPIRSTLSGETNASTEAVPRMNIRAIIGAEIKTERAMFRAGARHSPARIAMYSKPERAPTASLLHTLMLYVLNSGKLSAKGWYLASEPRPAVMN